MGRALLVGGGSSWSGEPSADSLVRAATTGRRRLAHGPYPGKVRAAMHEVDPQEVAALLSKSFSESPSEALDGSAGRFRSLVEWGCLRQLVGRYDRRSRRRSRLEFRFDESSNTYQAVSSADLCIPHSSLDFTEDGRLEHSFVGEIPLDELVFEYASTSSVGWRAIGFSHSSNTTVLFYAANTLALDHLMVPPPSRARVGDFGASSRFWLGSSDHPIAGTECALSSGAAVVEFKATPIKRQTLGAVDTRISFNLPRSGSVELIQTHASPCLHPVETRLQ